VGYDVFPIIFSVLVRFQHPVGFQYDLITGADLGEHLIRKGAKDTVLIIPIDYYGINSIEHLKLAIPRHSSALKMKKYCNYSAKKFKRSKKRLDRFFLK